MKAQSRNQSIGQLARWLLIPIVWLTLSAATPSEQTWTGTISDSMCGASHQKRAETDHLTERECVFQCIKALADYVLVDGDHQILRIANQDFPGLPFHAGRAVKISGELKGDSILISTIESDSLQ